MFGLFVIFVLAGTVGVIGWDVAFDIPQGAYFISAVAAVLTGFALLDRYGRTLLNDFWRYLRKGTI